MGRDQRCLCCSPAQGKGLQDPQLHHPSPLSPQNLPNSHIPKGCSRAWHFLFPPLTFPGPSAFLTAGKNFTIQTSSQGLFFVWICIRFGWFFRGSAVFSPRKSQWAIPCRPLSHHICWWMSWRCWQRQGCCRRRFAWAPEPPRSGLTPGEAKQSSSGGFLGPQAADPANPRTQPQAPARAWRKWVLNQKMWWRCFWSLWFKIMPYPIKMRISRIVVIQLK